MAACGAFGGDCIFYCDYCGNSVQRDKAVIVHSHSETSAYGIEFLYFHEHCASKKTKNNKKSQFVKKRQNK